MMTRRERERAPSDRLDIAVSELTSMDPTVLARSPLGGRGPSRLSRRTRSVGVNAAHRNWGAEHGRDLRVPCRAIRDTSAACGRSRCVVSTAPNSRALRWHRRSPAKLAKTHPKLANLTERVLLPSEPIQFRRVPGLAEITTEPGGKRLQCCGDSAAI